jgi:hypothetical protein
MVWPDAAGMDDGIFFGGSDAADQTRLEKLRGVALGIDRVLNLALALTQSGRRVDLSGIDRQVGILCAQSLDLPPALGRALVPCLQSQIAVIDQLFAAIRPS